MERNKCLFSRDLYAVGFSQRYCYKAVWMDVNKDVDVVDRDVDTSRGRERENKFGSGVCLVSVVTFVGCCWLAP